MSVCLFVCLSFSFLLLDSCGCCRQVHMLMHTIETLSSDFNQSDARKQGDARSYIIGIANNNSIDLSVSRNGNLTTTS